MGRVKERQDNESLRGRGEIIEMWRERLDNHRQRESEKYRVTREREMETEK